MDPNRRRQIEELYRAANARTPENRAAFLDGACGQDAGLRREVESLLEQSEDATATMSAGTAPLGAQFGPYRIVSRIGAGGMGEVYRAHDGKLGRDVAIKTLPHDFAQDPERLARFRREARTLASLNHPNIAAIYGLEESGNVECLVLELVEGETLRGPLPVNRALDYARQVAEALEAAHRKGIVHRDLKPGNVKVTPEGRVKVLDFGLAKAVWGTEIKDLSQMATVTELETVAGRIAGTPPYMSPEQARGKEVDRRTDIWAFGCLLYELLTGKRAFQGETLSDTIAAVLEREPDWKLLPAATPARIRDLLQRCLQRDEAGRPPDMGEVRMEIERSVGPHGGTKRWQLAAAASAVIAIFAVGAAWWAYGHAGTFGRSGPAPLKHATFTQLTDQPGQELYPSLAPDGKSFVYASRASGNWDIYFQRVGGKNPVNLTKDSPADDTQAVFSPDGERIAFRSERDGGGIFLMGATGENVKRITDSGYNPAWSPDGREIVCGSSTSDLRHQLRSQLFAVNVSTGEKRMITPQGYAMQPNWSPHGYRVAYWGLAGGRLDIWTIPARGGDAVAVTSDAAVDWNPVWSPDGTYLYFASDRGGSMNLWRVPIDEKSGKVLGEMEPVTTPSPFSAYISFARGGRLMAYVQRTTTANIYRVGFDASRETTVGQPVPVTQGSRVASTQNLSPDGEWLAFGTSGRENLFVVRRDGTGLRQLTEGDYRDRWPAWSPDGKHLAFYSNRSGKFDAWTIRPDGSGLQQLTFVPDGFVVYPVWAPDGKHLVYTIQNRTAFVMDLDQPWRSQSPRALPPLSDPNTWFYAFQWSSDGRKLAGFQARADGNFTGINIYSFDTDKYDRVTDFGWFPRWLSDGRRLLFHSELDAKIYLVDTRTRKVHELLSETPNTVGPPSVSPDDRWIYFTLGVSEGDIWLAHLE